MFSYLLSLQCKVYKRTPGKGLRRTHLNLPHKLDIPVVITHVPVCFQVGKKKSQWTAIDLKRPNLTRSRVTNDNTEIFSNFNASSHFNEKKNKGNWGCFCCCRKKKREEPGVITTLGYFISMISWALPSGLFWRNLLYRLVEIPYLFFFFLCFLDARLHTHTTSQL